MANKIKCYDVQDVVKRIPESKRIVDEKTFGHVVKQYFQNLVDVLFAYSQVKLPYGMGVMHCRVIDKTPYYDVKTKTVHGGIKVAHYFKGSTRQVNKFVKIIYYKGKLIQNPFRFFRFERSSYIEHKISEMYKNNTFDSLYTCKNKRNYG